MTTPRTPESLADALARIDRLLELNRQRERRLHELAQALVREIVEPVYVSGSYPPRRCERCLQQIGHSFYQRPQGEYALRFDGRWWHDRNCT